MRKIFTWIAGISILIFISAVVVYFVADEKLPQSVQNDRAEQLADKMLAAVNLEAWNNTDYVAWTFAGINEYKWYRDVDSVEVITGDYRVLLHTKTITGTAYKNGVELKGEEAQDAIQSAWSNFCNDSFWLAAPFKIKDPGTTRSLVKNKEDGGEKLLVSYSSGGVTPGDKYLWTLDENGLPTAYEMWVKIIPIGGAKATWEDYITLPSGAKIAQSHEMKVFTLTLSDITSEK